MYDILVLIIGIFVADLEPGWSFNWDYEAYTNHQMQDFIFLCFAGSGRKASLKPKRSFKRVATTVPPMYDVLLF